MGGHRDGHLFGIGAYVLWGFFPLYFKLLKPSGPLEILAHRVLWSAVFLALVLTVVRGWRRFAGLARRPGTLLVIGLAAALIAVNWGTYIYGVNTNRVVETSLGYFITPLISVAFGLVFFSERLRPAQWAALGVGTVAVAVLTVDYGRLPWIALTLAASFSSYGLVKKRLGLAAAGRSTFASSPSHVALLLVSGAVTAVPLMLFAASANRITMTGLGILQYIAPILQFLVGVVIVHEPMPAARLFGFALVWLALVVFTWDGLRGGRRVARDIEPAAEPVTAT